MLYRVMAFVVAAGCLSLNAPAVQAAGSATEVGASTCGGCHAEQAEAFKKTKHGMRLAPVKKIGFEKSCETCHGPGSLHAAAGGDRSNPDFATIKKPDAMAASEANGLCLSCHKSNRNLMLWGTSPHKEGGLACVKCHSVHKGEGKFNLAKDSVETCLACHKQKRGEIQMVSHHPLIEGKMTCASCHNPHGGMEYNLGGSSLEDTCFKCHANKSGPTAGEHPPVADSCANCHRPHGGPNEYMLKQPMPFLCLRCHKWPHVDTLKAGGTVNIGNKLSTIENRGRCTDCHRDIHGSERSGSLKR